MQLNISKASAWSKNAGKFCDSNCQVGSVYSSLAAAQEACSQNSMCSGVYDGECDNMGDFDLCKLGCALSTSRTGSCVYTKSQAMSHSFVKIFSAQCRCVT